jgi:hypothetical protein
MEHYKDAENLYLENYANVAYRDVILPKKMVAIKKVS